MSFLGLVVLIAAVFPLLTGGSYHRLAEAPWRWGGLLALGITLQLFLNTDLIPRSRGHDIGFGMLVASYVLIIGFCAGNVIVRGMSVVLIGVALNAFVITINQGMPVDVPPDWQRGRVEATVKHHPQVPGDHLLGLTDIIVLRRFDAIVSFGDLIMAFGLVDVTYWASRRTRRSRTRAAIHRPESTAAGAGNGPEAGDREDDGTPQPVSPEPATARSRRPNGSRPAPRREPARADAPRRPVVKRSGAGGATVAIKEALERIERP